MDDFYSKRAKIEPETPEEHEIRLERLMTAVAKIPRRTTMKELRAVYIEHVINVNDGHRTNASLELDIPYRTLTYIIYEQLKLSIPPSVHGVVPYSKRSRETIFKMKKCKKQKRKKNG